MCHHSVAYSIPQGSVPGPWFFLLYMNDFPNSSINLSFDLFADDTNTCFKSNSTKQLQKVVYSELKSIKMWLDANKLALSIDKSNFIILAFPKQFFG